MSAPENRTEALDAVKRAQEQWEAERAEVEARREGVDERRRRIVIDALDSGLSVSEVAQAMGLSPARIYQIRDGRR